MYSLSRPFRVVAGFFISAFLLLACCKSIKEPPEKLIARQLLEGVEQFGYACENLKVAVGRREFNEKEGQELFLKIRRAYKAIEWAVEYFEPATARMLNGAPVEEVEGSGQVFPASGLQVIEPMLWPRYDSSEQKELLGQLETLEQGAEKCRNHFNRISLFDWQIFDAGKLEVFRVETLGITGFDNPLTLQSTRESAIALRALIPVFGVFAKKAVQDSLRSFAESAAEYLDTHSDFDRFDRAVFIRRYANPLSSSIELFQQSLSVRVTRYNRLLNQDVFTPFDSGAFNPNAYVPDLAAFATPEKISLGQKLFSDPVLSGSGKRSCQTCHQPGQAFADGLAKNTVMENVALLARNTPSLLNAALQPALFADLRVKTLEAQSIDVVESAAEMHGSMTTSATRLWKHSSYRRLFSLAFPRRNREGIDTGEVMNAIGSYVRSLTRLNSRFDDFMRGNNTALSAEETAGFNLFMGKAKCGTCHYMPLFSGVFPPRYIKMESEVIGTPVTINSQQIDPDSGRYAIIPRASFLHAFKTPTLRNAALTAPYMHNGVFRTLDEVINFYNKGGGKGQGIKISNQTLPFDKLNLDSPEQKAIVAFIKTLNSR